MSLVPPAAAHPETLDLRRDSALRDASPLGSPPEAQALAHYGRAQLVRKAGFIRSGELRRGLDEIIAVLATAPRDTSR